MPWRGRLIISPWTHDLSPGLISLNWSLHPSGVFRFATENADLTGLTYPDGFTPLLLYEAAATENSGYSDDLERSNSIFCV